MNEKIMILILISFLRYIDLYIYKSAHLRPLPSCKNQACELSVQYALEKNTEARECSRLACARHPCGHKNSLNSLALQTALFFFFILTGINFGSTKI